MLRTFPQHRRRVHCLALLPDGRRFICGSTDGITRIVEHGLACKPEQIWLDAKPKRDALEAAAAAARAAREPPLRASAALRGDLQRRIKELEELEQEVEAAGDDVPQVQEASARLVAAVECGPWSVAFDYTSSQ